MSEETKTYFETTASENTSLLIRGGGERENLRAAKAVFAFMKERGWEIQTDQDVLKNFPTLAKTHFEGKLGDLLFKADVTPLQADIEFYQEINKEHKKSGKYDFRKLRMMPYLIRLRFLTELKHMKSFLAAEGFSDKSEKPAKTAMEGIARANQKSFEKFEVDGIPKGAENTKYFFEDKHKAPIAPGQMKYFRDRKGHLMRGIAYYNNGNMWWVKLNGRDFRNMAHWELFDWENEESKARKILNEKLCEKYKLRSKEKVVQLKPKVTVKKAMVEKYLVHAEGEWAEFFVDVAYGTLTINSSFGTWSHGWSSYGDDLKAFLEDATKEGEIEYLLRKLARLDWFDFDATIARWKEHVLEMRKDKDITKEEAREAMEEIDSIEDEGDCSAEELYHRYEESERLKECFGCDFVSESMRMDYSPSAKRMAQIFFPLLNEIMREELKEKKLG